MTSTVSLSINSQIVPFYSSERTLEEIAKKFSIGKTTLRNKSMTYKEIRQVYGVALNTVMYHLRKLENKRSCDA
jgi:predicted transcriptional regulator